MLLQEGGEGASSFQGEEGPGKRCGERTGSEERRLFVDCFCTVVDAMDVSKLPLRVSFEADDGPSERNRDQGLKIFKSSSLLHELLCGIATVAKLRY